MTNINHCLTLVLFCIKILRQSMCATTIHDMQNVQKSRLRVVHLKANSSIAVTFRTIHLL